MTLDHDRYVFNILRTYALATSDEVQAGAHWYDTAHSLACELTPDDPWRAAGVISCYSPLNPWGRNRAMAVESLQTGIARPDFLPAMVKCAQRIIDGEPTLDVLRGQKTRAFAAAIADPANSTIATIDCHAHDIANGYVMPGKGRSIGKRLFQAMGEAYTHAGEITLYSTPQIQAITWVTWRRMIGVNWRDNVS